MHTPELLSPAGSLTAMRYAFAYGADAVYAGLPRLSLRVRNNAFDQDTLASGIYEAHSKDKQFYVVCNIAPHNSKLNGFVEQLEPIVGMHPDALIVSDPGVIYLIKQHFPSVPLHLSVQANTINWAAVAFWRDMGISRIILSRELGLKEIEEIRSKVPDMELEVFVHGALCMAYSGRCLLSGYFNKRDPNQGACTNACRWEYKVSPAVQDDVGQINPLPDAVMLEEPQRPGEYMPMFEDLHGTYILNSKDLRAVQHVRELTEMGVHSLKIEGRTKSPYYVARTAQVYRRAIDDAIAGRPFNPQLLVDLEGMANRGFTEGFLRRHVSQSELQNYEQSHSTGQQQFVGALSGDMQCHSGKTWVLVDVRNRFAVGDALILMTPSGNHEFLLNGMQNQSHETVNIAPGSGHQVWISVPSIPALQLTEAMLIRKILVSEQDLQNVISIREVK